MIHFALASWGTLDPQNERTPTTCFVLRKGLHISSLCLLTLIPWQFPKLLYEKVTGISAFGLLFPPTLMKLEATLGPLRDIQTLLEEFLYLGVQRRTLAWEWTSGAEGMFYGNPTVKGPAHFKSTSSVYRGIEKLLTTWGTLKRAQESGEILSTKQMI